MYTNDFSSNQTETVSSYSKKIDKAYILLDFDGSIKNSEDERVVILNKYGFRATAIPYDKKMTEEFARLNWDTHTYCNAESVLPPNETINDMSESNLKLWDTYVKAGKQRDIDVGLNPISWACRQNRYGTALEYALKKNGYKICRGYTGSDFVTEKTEEQYLRLSCYGCVGENCFEATKEKIDYAIENKCALVLLTHWLVESISPSFIWNTTIKDYEKILDYLKIKSDSGLCDVITYKELYEKFEQS